jgi:hypothetical protein
MACACCDPCQSFASPAWHEAQVSLPTKLAARARSPALGALLGDPYSAYRTPATSTIAAAKLAPIHTARFRALPVGGCSLAWACSATGLPARGVFCALFRDELLCRLRAKVFRPTGQGSGTFSVEVWRRQ